MDTLIVRGHASAWLLNVELLAGTTSVPDWRRKPGRPRSSWLRGVLNDVHLTAQEAWTAAGDREGWRERNSPLPTTRSDDDDDDLKKSYAAI